MPRVLVRQDNSIPGIITYVGEHEVIKEYVDHVSSILHCYPISANDFQYIEENELVGKYTEVCIEKGIAEIFHFDLNLLIA